MKNRNLELPVVKDKRPMDYTPAELIALAKLGYKIPLSARLGRGPLFVIDNA